MHNPRVDITFDALKYRIWPRLTEWSRWTREVGDILCRSVKVKVGRPVT